MDIKKTNRGFDFTEFKDRNDNECSLQKSSIATEDCIWLGVSDPKVQVCDNGWRDVELPEGTLISSRMHLTREQVKELLPYLQKFVETGELT
jgi:hypothetical protein